MPDESDSEILTKYLGTPVLIREPGKGGGRIVESSLHAALRDCRSAQGRERDGSLDDGVEAASWLGAIGYLCVLDQLDTAVRRTDVADPASGHFRVLRQCVPSDEMSDDEIEALYALRCALAHDYSVANSPPKWQTKNRQRLLHVFRLYAGARDRVVELPEGNRWNGEYGDASNTHGPTIVSLRGLGDLVERVVSSVRSAHESNHLVIHCDDGAAEMDERYFFSHNSWDVLANYVELSNESPAPSGSASIADLSEGT
jgi:hypothetical protein